MRKPTLLIVAGCNGSGKSTFSKSLVNSGIVPFDYDFYYLKYYSSLRDSDIRDRMAHNMAFDELERQITNTISNGLDFCYETNFNSTPLHWPLHFKRNGYRLHLIYFCLDSVQEAIRRVAIRVENGGHYVPESEIIVRYKDGYNNLNLQFRHFDYVDIFDTSTYLREPYHVLSIENGETDMKVTLPPYLNNLVPDIAATIS